MNPLISKVVHFVDSMDHVRKHTPLENIKGSRSKEGCVCVSLPRERLYTSYMGLPRVPCSPSSPSTACLVTVPQSKEELAPFED